MVWASLTIITNWLTAYCRVTDIDSARILLRYMQITFVENKSGSPTKILLNDRFIKIVILLSIFIVTLFFMFGFRL